MEQLYLCSVSGTTVSLIRGLGSEREDAERELIAASVNLPISDRSVWAAGHNGIEPWFLLVREASGRVCGGVAVEQVASRALPGHRILRLRRSGGNLTCETFRVVLESLKVLLRRNPRILRVFVQTFSLGRRDETVQMLAGHGFRELKTPSVYRHTLVMDLKPSEEEIFATFSDSCRNKVRKTIRKSMQSVVINDAIYEDRIRELQREALRRTVGHVPTEDWKAILKMSRERPDLSSIFGLFEGEDRSPETMVAFGWVCSHGNHAEYRAAGSTRRAGVKIPYGYLLAWDMIRWAKASGAEWFDFGGVTLGGGDDRLKGISDFKRSFSREVVEVGAEWVCDPYPFKAWIADTISRSVKKLRGLKGGRTFRGSTRNAFLAICSTTAYAGALLI